MTMDDRLLREENGFLLVNGTFIRFNPIGLTWNDSYCRRIVDGGPSGCYLERDIDLDAIDDRPMNNCSGICSNNQH